jgi:hypothetical protein
VTSKEKRSLAEKVRRRFSHEAARLGFHRGRTSFWYRERGHVIHFIHLHLFSFCPAFRVHLGIRALNDSFDAAALNGPSTPDHLSPSFEESVEECVRGIHHFCEATGEPWFGSWPATALATDGRSPLSPNARLALAEALEGRADGERAALSRSLLGAA